MEFQTIANFFNTASDDNKKWIEVYDQSGENCNVNKEIRIKTLMLKSDLCNYSDAYIVVKGTITIITPNNTKKTNVLHLIIMYNSSIAFQKLMAKKLIMQKI